MSYVKLTAKPGGWFKAGTEVYSYDCDPKTQPIRMTLEEWGQWAQYRTIGGEVFQVLVRGRRVPDKDKEIVLFGPKERWDDELCPGCEFEVEFVEEAQ